MCCRSSFTMLVRQTNSGHTPTRFRVHVVCTSLLGLVIIIPSGASRGGGGVVNPQKPAEQPPLSDQPSNVQCSLEACVDRFQMKKAESTQTKIPSALILILIVLPRLSRQKSRYACSRTSSFCKTNASRTVW